MREEAIKKMSAALFLGIAMLIAWCLFLPVQVKAAEEWYADYEYELDDIAGTITLKKYTGAGGDIFVPRSVEIDGRTYRTVLQAGFSHLLFSYHEEITGITFESGFVFPEDCTALFDFCQNLTRVTFPDDLDTTNVKNMRSMFSDCKALEALDVSMFDTGNVEDFEGMFFGCEKLTHLDVSNFDTRNAANMEYMFSCCKAMETLDLSGFDTSNVETMECMFSNCFSLKSLNISSFNTAKVTNMRSMFSYCSSLEHIDVSSFDTGSVVTMKDMFISCTSLKELDLSGFDTAHVEDFYAMFSYLELEEIDLSAFHTESARNMGYMFSNANKLKRLDLSGFDMSAVEDCSFMFLGTSSLLEIVTPKAMSEAGTDFYSLKKYARKDAQGIYMEPLYEDLKEAPAQTPIYRYRTYTVQFNANGGEGTMEDQKIQMGIPVRLNPNRFTRANSVFVGWVKDYSSDAKVYADEEAVEDLTYDGGTVRLYAKWKRITSFSVSLPAQVRLSENLAGTTLTGTVSYHLEFTGEPSDYISVTADAGSLSDGHGNTILLTAANSKEKWKYYDYGVTRDSATGVASGDGTIAIRSAESTAKKDSGDYTGTLVVTVRSGTD